MLHSKMWMVVALAFAVGCKGKDKAGAKEAPVKEAPKPVAAEAAKPAAPAEPADIPKEEQLADADDLQVTKTAIAGFPKGAVFDMPVGFKLGKHASEDGEGDSITASNGAYTLNFVHTLGKGDPTLADHKRGREEFGPKPTWIRETSDANGFVLASEANGKSSISVYVKSVHGFCTADDVETFSVDQAIAICKTLRAK